MEPRNWVKFITEFPDDSHWDDKGNLLVPGGRGISEFIRNHLQGQGFNCSDVDQHSFYGWAFDAATNKAKFYCVLAEDPEGGWYLILDKKMTMRSIFACSSETPEFENLQIKVHDLLTSNSQFSNVLWFTRRQFKSGKDEQGYFSPR